MYLDASCICLVFPIFDKFVITALPGHLNIILVHRGAVKRKIINNLRVTVKIKG